MLTVGKGFDTFLNIQLPEILHRYNGEHYEWKYVSTKYLGVSGEWKRLKTDAKKSYKEELKEHLKKGERERYTLV